MRIISILILVFIYSCTTSTSSNDTNDTNDNGNQDNTYTISVKTLPDNGGVVSITPEQDVYESGTVISLEANPSEGWKFKSWSGDISGNENPKNVTINSSLNIETLFDFGIRVIGGSSSDRGGYISKTSDGGYVITGSFKSTDGDFEGLNNTSPDIFVLKFDEFGQLEWTKSFGGSGTDQGLSIIQSNDDGFVITGQTNSNTGDFSNKFDTSFDSFIIKLNSNGNKEWVKTYGGSGQEVSYSVTETNEGGFAIIGRTDSNDGDFEGLNKGVDDLFAIYLNSSGETQWLKVYGGSESDQGFSITSNESNEVIVTGRTNSIDGDFERPNDYISDSDIIGIKINTSGETQWVKTYGTSNPERANSILANQEGDLFITGSIYLSGHSDVFILKINSIGEEVWLNNYGVSNDESGRSILINNDNLIVTGVSLLPSNQNDIYTIKTDLVGNEIWTRTYGGSQSDNGNSLIYSKGNIIIVGEEMSNDGDFEGLNNGFQDIFILKLNNDGEIILQ